MIRALAAAWLATMTHASALADDLPLPLATALQAHIDACATFDDGKLTVGDSAITRPDLDGRAPADWALDSQHLACTTAASAFCGTGGCTVHFLVDGTLTEELSKGWRSVDFGPYRVLLFQVHGSECGGTNLTPCVDALVWSPDDAKFARARSALAGRSAP